MPGRLAGKVALVTGGGTGIGAAIARRFAASGAPVAVTGRRPEPLAEVAAEVGGLALAGDTTSPADCAAAVGAAVARLGGLDVVVANAGVIAGGSVTSQDPAAWEEVLRVNVGGVMQICRAALPALLARGGGAVVVVSSVAGLASGSETASYVTSKHAVIGLARSMAYDYGPRGVRVNVLCPGWVRTPMSEEEMRALARARGTDEAEAVAATVRPLPLRRMAEPAEIAACAEFLASDDASFVTGAVLVADGGGAIVDVGTLSFGGD